MCIPFLLLDLYTGFHLVYLGVEIGLILLFLWLLSLHSRVQISIERVCVQSRDDLPKKWLFDSEADLVAVLCLKDVCSRSCSSPATLPAVFCWYLFSSLLTCDRGVCSLLF